MGNNTSDLKSPLISIDSKDVYVLYYNEATRSTPGFLPTYERLMDLLKNNYDSYQALSLNVMSEVKGHWPRRRSSSCAGAKLLSKMSSRNF